MEKKSSTFWRYRLRKTPFRIFWRLLLYQFFLGIAWLIFAMIFDAAYLENKLVIFSIVTFGEMTISSIIFFQWFFEYYRIADMELVYRKGIFLRKEEIYSLQEIAKIQTSQGILGKLFDYGNIVIFYRFDKTPLHIDNISDIEATVNFLNAEVREAAEDSVRRITVNA